MSITTPYKFQLDETGNNPANSVAYRHILTGINHLPHVCPEGLFYSERLIITRVSDGVLMTRGTDYELVGYEQWLTELTGIEVFAGIDFLDKGDASSYDIELQVIGGPEGTAISYIKSIKEALEIAANNPTIDYNTQVKNKPTYFNPAPHKHVIQDMEDLELLTQTLDDMLNALVNRQPMQDSGMHFQEQIDRLMALVGRVYNRINAVSAGSAGGSQLADAISLLSNFVKTEDVSITVAAASNTVLSIHDINDVNVLRGIVMIDTGTEIESIDFMVTSIPGTPPVIQTFAISNVFGNKQILDLDVGHTGSSLVVYGESAIAGNIKIKYYAVL